MSTKSSKKSKPSVREQLLSRFGELLVINQPISSFVPSRVGGVAEFILKVHSIDEICDAAKIAVENDLEYVVVGGATGILPSDYGFPGLIIVNKVEGISFNEQLSQVVIYSGTPNSTLLSMAASRGFGGVEFLSVIPGTIGGAITTNAGLGPVNASTIIREVTLLVFEGAESKVVTVTKEQLLFEPGGSVLANSTKYPPIILTARLQLARLPQEEIMKRLSRYKDRHTLVYANKPMLGSFFTPSLEYLPNLFRDAKRVRATNVRIYPSEGLLSGVIDKTLAKDYRLVIDQLQGVAQAKGIVVKRRIRYLGNWPEEEENATT